MNQHQIELQRAIAEIENHYPANDFITTYKDFLKHREILHLYQFNMNVFCSLIDLSFYLWVSKDRINRASLLRISKKYLEIANSRKDIPEETATKMFELFRQVIVFENLNLAKRTIEELKVTINSMLIGVTLTERQLYWLIENIDKSYNILNRILRQPKKSAVISKWARKNYNNDIYRQRRAEMASWIIDEDPTFEINIQTLITDFEYINKLEELLIKEYEDEYAAHKTVEDQLRPIFIDPNALFALPEDDDIKEKFLFNEPKFEGIKRFYDIGKNFNEEYQYFKPNLAELSDHFYSNLDSIFKVSMAWSIAYSRLTKPIKTKMLKKYYSHERINTFLKIGKKIKSVELLEWLMKKNNS